MKNVIKFIAFLIYTISIFFIKNYIILMSLFCINVLITVLLKIDFKRLFENFLILLPFILFTVLINIIFENIFLGILIGIRLILCYNITYAFSRLFTIMEFSNTIEKICIPLKLFKVNTRNIGIIISIAICMIPVFKNEMQDMIKTMKSKGKNLKINNISILMKPVLIQTLRRTNQIEKTLISKGYIE